MGAVVLNPSDLGTQVVVTTQPMNVEETIFGGFSWGSGITVAVENSAGDIDPFVQEGTITIALDSNPTGDKLDNTLTSLTEPLVYGLSIFGGITMDKPAIGYTFEATYSLPLPNPDTVLTDPFDVAGPAQSLVVTTEPPLPPSSVQAGVAFGLTISAEDFEGVVVPSFDDPVAISILANPPGITGVLNGTTVVGALYGVADFSGLTIDQAGNGYTIQASDLSPGTTVGDGVTDPFDVTPGPATQLVFKAPGEPDGDPISTAAAGSDFANPSNVVVYAEDQFGSVATSYNGPVTIALANNATGLTGTLTVNATNGVATFTDLEIDPVGTYELAATSGTLNPTPDSTSITITPAAAAGFTWVTQPPTKVTEGIPFGATLQLEDAYGNPTTDVGQDFSVLLDLNGTPEPGDLAGTTTGVTASSNGQLTFSNIIINALSPTSPLEYFHITASSGTGPGTFQSAPSAGIDVVPPQLVVTSPADNTTVTASVNGFAMTVQVQTYLGAIDTSAGGTDTVSIVSGPTGANPISGNTASDTNGVANFGGVVLETAGTYVLQVANGNFLPADITITVAAAAPTGLVFEQQPPMSVVAGVPFGVEVEAGHDQFGNQATLTGSVTVGFGSNPTNTTLNGTLTVTINGSGVAIFQGLTIDIVNNPLTPYTLTATSGSLPSITSNGIDVTPAAASQLVIATQPVLTDEPSPPLPAGTVYAGQPFTWVVDAEDKFGNLDTNYTSPVTVVQPSTITGTTTLDASAGVADFTNLSIDLVGTYTLQATSGALSTVALKGATDDTVTVIPDPNEPAALVWVPNTGEPPAQVIHGDDFSASLKMLDQFGNLETGYIQDVTIAIDNNPSGGNLGGTLTLPASGGIVTFNPLTIDTIGDPYTLIASSDNINSPASTPIDVLAIPAASLSVTGQQPSGTIAVAQSFGLSVTALDAHGNPDPDFDGSVTLALVGTPGSNTLSGTTTVNAVNGVATFSGLTLAEIGQATIQVSSSGLPSITTTINVNAAAATQLVVVTQPQTPITAGTPFGLEVEAEDPFGNQATNFDGSVTVTLSGATLNGTATAQASGGIVNFSDLSVDTVGSYTLQVSTTVSGNTFGTATDHFTVTPAAAAELVIPPPASRRRASPPVRRFRCRCRSRMPTGTWCRTTRIPSISHSRSSKALPHS